jgi:hypothetical protein
LRRLRVLQGCGGMDKAGPTLCAGAVTGIFASLSFFAITVIDGAQFSSDSFGRLLLGMMATGFLIGLTFLWPLSYLCSILGMKIAASQLWARNWTGWAASGAGIGGVLLAAFALAQEEPLSSLVFAACGAVYGSLAGTLCYRWIDVKSLFAIDPQV